MIEDLGRQPINSRPVAWFRDWLAFRSGRSEPELFRRLDLRHCLRWSIAKCRTHRTIGNVCDISFVFFAKENIDVVILHRSRC